MDSVRLPLTVVAAALFVGCGGDPETRPAGEPSKPAATERGVPEPYELTCRDLRAPAARREAIEFVADVLSVPPGQPRRRTIGIVRRSLKETCALPTLPNVDDPADYYPVRPVRQAVQNHFDQDAIYEP